MAFDRRNSAHLLLLKNEVMLDAQNVGYDPNASDTEILSLLNTPASNPGGETDVPLLTVSILLTVINVEEMNTILTDSDRNWIGWLMDASIARIVRPEDYKSKLTTIFPGGGATRAALNALSEPISRAEVLFGKDVIILDADWHTARDS